MGERQTGRTTRMLESAPRGSIIIAHNFHAARLIERAAKEMGRGDLKFRSFEDDYLIPSLRGIRNAILLDHAVYEFWGRTDKMVELGDFLRARPNYSEASKHA